MPLWMDRPEIKSAAAFLLLSAVIVLLGYLLRAVMVPTIIAAVVYVLAEPAVSALQRRGWNRSLAIGMILVAMVGLVVWLIVAVIPLLVDQFELLRTRLPQAWTRFTGLLALAEQWVELKAGVTIEHGAVLEKLTGNIQGWSSRALSAISGVLADLALWLVLIPAIAFFLLRDYRSLRNGIIGSLPNSVFEGALTIYHRVSDQLQAYIRGVMLQSAVMAAVTSTGFLIAGLPMAIPLGIAAGILNLIPYLGPLLGLIPPLLVALSMGADPDVYFIILITMGVAQLNDNFVVVPTILARAANLHALVAIVGVIVGGNFFGLAGMVGALPVLATARIILSGLYSGFARIPNAVRIAS